MPESAEDFTRRSIADLREKLLRLEGRVNTYEAVYDRDRKAAEEWRVSAIGILEEIKDASALGHDQVRREFREFMAAQAQTNGDLYEKVNRAAVESASDHGKVMGASGVIAVIITVATTLLSNLIGWPAPHR